MTGGNGNCDILKFFIGRKVNNKLKGCIPYYIFIHKTNLFSYKIEQRRQEYGRQWEDTGNE